MDTGIALELQGVDLGDRRLNARSLKVIEALSKDPQASVNGAVEGWGDTQAAYRLLDNPNVTPEKILKPHRQATAERMRAESVVLMAQDTTVLDYSAHPPKDARCLSRTEQFGFYHHVQLALSPDRVPLGVVGTKNFDRTPESLEEEKHEKRKRRTKTPIEGKESFRWLEGYRNACQLAAECPDTQVVSLADSEADIYDIFVEAQQAAADGSTRADYVIRAHENRSTPERNREVSRRTWHKVFDQVQASPLRTRHQVELHETPKREARLATLEIRALEVQVKPPNHRPDEPHITHNMVLVQEVHGPDDGTDVSWMLMTTLPIDTVEDVLRVIDFYVVRWTIEVWFRTLKTGCRVEELQLETRARLQNCLAFYNIIAWRVLFLTLQNRAAPDQPCTVFFADHEWKPVWCVTTKQPLPKKPPSLAEMMKLLTRLGGYNNRNTERPPGPQPVWIGLRRMLDYAIAWQTFGPTAEKRCV